MKTKIIYTILFAVCTLFFQAFGAQYEPPTILDTTICVQKGDTIKVYKYEEQILRLLERRAKEIWESCCDKVSVELKSFPIIKPGSLESPEGRQIGNINDWPAIITEGNTAFSLEVTYIRHLRCSDILKCKEDTSRASSAIWHIFGDLLSEADTGTTMRVSDTAYISTKHTVNLIYRFGISFPKENIDFKIQGDSCFNNRSNTLLSVPESYSSCRLKWFKPENVGLEDEYKDTMSTVRLYPKDDSYLFPIVCMAISCTGDTVSNTIKIGHPTPTPAMEDLACIAANDTSFEVNVNNPNSQLSYHWTLEDFGNGTIVDTQQGASVTMSIPQNKSVRLSLRSSGGCRDAEMEPMILHRSLVSEAHHIEMEAEPHCIFAGDTLRLSLSETPEDTLVWQIADNTTMLPPRDTYNYQALQAKDNVVVSIYAKACPNDIITDTFNIREDFNVSLGSSPMCIRANEYQVIGLTSNGINPEVHWYGNGVDIDSSTYKKEDSIRLKLTNPGGQNLYVKVTAAECGKFSKDSIALRPKPETPSLDTLWNALTSCVPLGIEDTIELRVQPQEGVKFKWSMPDIITKPDSNSIWVRVNYGLSDRNTSIPVSVYAYTDGCSNGSDTLSTTLYAIGAGLGGEWNLLQQNIMEGLYFVGFSDNDVLVDEGFTDPFDGRYSFDWYSDCESMGETSFYIYTIVVDGNPIVPFNLFCKLTSVERQCYSVYSIEVVDMMEQQDVLFAAKKGGEETGKGRETESLQAQAPFEQEDTPCPGIVLKPNPVRSGVQVKVEGICETESFTVECYSSQGRLMFRTTAKGDTFTLPTDNYAAGVYIVKIQLNGTAAPVVKKLIIL